ncbi:MAG: outer membrane lipoprotein-sorting protein [Spirochaetales bacterium]|nr:outer membrane lipoprotein-sorting protein [Spirochaetales bacterium]
MMKRKIMLFGLLALSFALTAAMHAQEADMNKILDEIDKLNNFDDTDFSCVYTIVAEKPGEERSITEALLFRRDVEDKFLLLIRKPEVKRGEGYLMEDDNVWFYDPESREFEHSSLSESFSDSDAKNDDFDRGTLSEEYFVESWESAVLGGNDVYVLSLKARNSDVTYDRMKLWVRKDVSVVIKAEEYGFSGNLMRTAGYFDYVKIGKNKIIPSRVLMIDNLNIGEKTQITLKNPSLKDIPDNVFTKSYLERVNQ